jgi:hypothetical protein
MGRSYEVTWDINCATKEEVDKITEQILDLDDGYFDSDGNWSGYGSLHLGGGVSPDEYGEAIANRIFDLIGRKVPLDFHVTYIEQAPTDTFSYGEESLERNFNGLV